LVCIPPEPRFFQVSIPCDLAAKSSNPRLSSKHEQAQSSFNRGLARAIFAAPHGLSHQIVVNLNSQFHQVAKVLRVFDAQKAEAAWKENGRDDWI
jgi:hypothetical protein